jgi:DNA invertase Pin-like site-specific DNA recombinase
MLTAALKEYGCELIYSEKILAIKTRPELEKMNQHLRSSDTV